VRTVDPNRSNDTNDPNDPNGPNDPNDLPVRLRTMHGRPPDTGGRDSEREEWRRPSFS